MDKEQYIEKILVLAHQENKLPELTESVCAFFDYMKDQILSHADMHFLRHISSLVGIPHYYDMLKNFQYDDIESYDLNLSSLSSLIYEKTLCTPYTKLHKHQVEVLKNFVPNKQNRFFLSASTSFGKTFLVYEIIRKMQYSNIALIFPTIALLSENYERIMVNKNYSDIREKYQIFTLSECQYNSENGNLFIFTPERFLSFLDKNDLLFDFVFIDEIYKIDNEFIENEENKEHERDTSYRIALYNALQNNTDMLLAGPFLEFNQNTNSSFANFITFNRFKAFNYNQYRIVNKSHRFQAIKKQKDRETQLYTEIQRILDMSENAIVYCSGPDSLTRQVKNILENNVIVSIRISKKLETLIAHIEQKFHSDWILVKALKQGIGIHHSRIPKYLQQEIISLFNAGDINILFSTTTITEGVNTSAKNLIVFKGKKANKALKNFDAKNIEGRAGRFMHHFSGNVIILDPDFKKALEKDNELIQHKNYDKESKKEEIDLFITDKIFLKEEEIQKREELIKEAQRLGIDNNILKSYQSISYSQKINLYVKISNLTQDELGYITTLIQKTNMRQIKIDWVCCDWLIKFLSPMFTNNDFKRYALSITRNQSLTITSHLHYFLKDGYIGLIKYYIKKDQSVDISIDNVSKCVFQFFKYQLVKYLGIFNLIYKQVQADKLNKKPDEIGGLDRLLSKLEYNAVTNHGKMVSDYGAPNAIIEYYETYSTSPQQAKEIERRFDTYEKDFLEKIKTIIPLQINTNEEK
ncbi:helicase-related protein [uncultured Helicobacter sp.]|uniref:helicase-related protein n=1 Tax=uncultured Helicobacter sp. TaxID=175537 RepID=UPI001F959BFD|nr:helicase-related protein [uncultured Helicobacter sp.]HIY44477.1 hypothetical protein [Candidatus Helicobacter avistercoris]